MLKKLFDFKVKYRIIEVNKHYLTRINIVHDTYYAIEFKWWFFPWDQHSSHYDTVGEAEKYLVNMNKVPPDTFSIVREVV